MRETKIKEIDGISYTVTQLGAITGRKVMARMPKMRDMDDATMDFLCDAFAASTTVPMAIQASKASSVQVSLKDVFDDHFAGKYKALMEWLYFCVEVNFGGDVFTSPAPDPGTAKVSESPPASIGVSGG
jgi:hypothetical protein